MIVITPPFQTVPEGASIEHRRRMLADWKREFARSNPHLVRADCSPRGFWGSLAYLFGRRA